VVNTSIAGPSILAEDKRKYNMVSSCFKEKVLRKLSEGPAKLVMAAYTNNTWKAMETASNTYTSYSKTTIENSISQDQITSFIWWCYSEKNLKHATINSYVSSLATLQKLMGNNLDFATSYLTKTVLKGVRNAEAVQAPKESTRLVFSLPLLKILGHCLMSQDWDPDSKRIFWAASTLLFFGSFRVSEILSKNEYSYDPLTTLVWSDVLQVGEALRIHVKFPKVFSAKGIFVDLFPIDDVTICPVHCLKNLRSKVENQDEPVFKFGTGKLLTPNQFNKSLKELLGTVLTPEENQFTSHSFRAAIPAALAENPDLASKQELKLWGRWDSNAYLKYTRLQYEQRKITFHSICKMFNIRPAKSTGAQRARISPERGQVNHL
jgi:hypothetical protein